jgi:hypothetical protein
MFMIWHQLCGQLYETPHDIITIVIIVVLYAVAYT